MDVLDELYLRFREAVEVAGYSEIPSQFLQHWVARTLEDALEVVGDLCPGDVMLEVGVGSEVGTFQDRPRRIDILVRDRVIIETKRPGELNSGGRLEEARDQLLRYFAYLVRERDVRPEDVLAVLTDGEIVVYYEVEKEELVQEGPRKLDRSEFRRMIKTILRRVGEDPSPLEFSRTSVELNHAAMVQWIETWKEVRELLERVEKELTGDGRGGPRDLLL
ncbi:MULTISPECIES: hypothetical protein [unclassified Methanopyrus]|uniref:hypothetical protein n=1 Tax=Methanopyrus sp. SNP6 TaxID=1937005 RepID=UPI0011E5E183|nr:hypothetical protein [Methanopyrus sp. SNP6]